MTAAAVIGIVVFVAMIALIMLGVPVFLSMLLTSFVGFCLVGGVDMAILQFTTAPLALGASYTYAVLPLFILIGTIAEITGIAEGTFVAMQKWLGRIRGGLLYAVVTANAAFGACSGISTAGNVVFGRIALPELEKAKYDRKLSLGTITGAGSLSSLIPPSVPIILVCIITDLSIGKTLIFGLSSGILMVILLCLAIFVYLRIMPKKVPDTSTFGKVSLRERVFALRLLIPIVLVFAFIIGGTVFGWFPATVVGAVAVVILLVYALAKRVPLKKILHSIWDAAIMNGGIFPIIVAGMIFSRFVTITGLVDEIAAFIIGANLPAYVLFLIIVVFYIFCGCVMDIISIIIITVPIVLPLLTSVGFNQYVIAVMLVFMCEIAGLTPPIGMNVFVMSNALRIKPMEIFSGILPFFLVELTAVLIIGALPQIITWLPRLLGLS